LCDISFFSNDYTIFLSDDFVLVLILSDIIVLPLKFAFSLRVQQLVNTKFKPYDVW
jgi:hypothetical protein